MNLGRKLLPDEARVDFRHSEDIEWGLSTQPENEVKLRLNCVNVPVLADLRGYEVMRKYVSDRTP